MLTSVSPAGYDAGDLRGQQYRMPVHVSIVRAARNIARDPCPDAIGAAQNGDGNRDGQNAAATADGVRAGASVLSLLSHCCDSEDEVE